MKQAKEDVNANIFLDFKGAVVKVRELIEWRNFETRLFDKNFHRKQNFKTRRNNSLHRQDRCLVYTMALDFWIQHQNRSHP